MSEPSETDRARRARELEDRAKATIAAIMSGGDLAAETERLSNTYTDEMTERIAQRLRGR